MAARQLVDELFQSTQQQDAASLKPRVSTSKKQQSKPLMKARKTGATQNLRRLNGGPSHDLFTLPDSDPHQPTRTRIGIGGIPSPRRAHLRRDRPPRPRPGVDQALTDATTPHPPEDSHLPRQSSRNADQPEQETIQEPEAAAPNESTGEPRRRSRSSRSPQAVAPTAEEPVSAAGGADRNSPRVVIPILQKVRPSSLFSGGVDISEAIAVDENERRLAERRSNRRIRQTRQDTPRGDKNQETPAAKKRKATAPGISTKRVKTARQYPRTPNLGQHRALFDQEARLREVYKTVEQIGWTYKDGERYKRSEVDLDDEQVRQVKKLCRAAKIKLSALVNPPDDDDDDAADDDDDDDEESPADPPEEWTRIIDQIESLKTTEEYYTDQTKVNNIFYHLFAAVIKLVRHAIDCYGEIDQHSSSSSSSSEGGGGGGGENEVHPQHCCLTIPHLQNISQPLQSLISLHDTLAKSYCDPHPALHVKQPLKKIITHLRHIHQRFTREIHHHQALQNRRKEALIEAERTDRIAQQAKHDQDIANRREEIQKKWIRLHLLRHRAEPNIIPAWKQAHLRIPDLCYPSSSSSSGRRRHEEEAEQEEWGGELDRDIHGNLFHRVQLFAPRLGPSFNSINQARQVIWTKTELHALREGLRRFAKEGEGVWEGIFRSYCRRGGALERFNVTEIVCCAADLRCWEEGRLLERKGSSSSAGRGMEEEEEEEWVRELEGVMWVRSKIRGVGQENSEAWDL